MKTIIATKGCMKGTLKSSFDFFIKDEDECIYVNDLVVVEDLAGFLLKVNNELIPFNENLRLFFNKKHYSDVHQICNIFNMNDGERVVYDSKISHLMQHYGYNFLPEGNCFSPVENLMFNYDGSQQFFMCGHKVTTPRIQAATYYGLSGIKDKVFLTAKNGFENDNAGGMSEDDIIPSFVVTVYIKPHDSPIKEFEKFNCNENARYFSIDDGYNGFYNLATQSRLTNRSFMNDFHIKVCALEEKELREKYPNRINFEEKVEKRYNDLKNEYKDMGKGRFWNEVNSGVFIDGENEFTVPIYAQDSDIRECALRTVMMAAKT